MSLVQAGFTLPGIVRSLTPTPPPTTIVGGPTLSAAGNYGTFGLSDLKSVEFTPRTTAQDFKYFGWDAEVDVAGQRLIYVGSKLDFTFNPITNSDPGAIFPALTLQQSTLTTNSNMSHEVRLQNDERIAGMFDYVVGYFTANGNPETILSSGSTLNGYFPVTNAVDPRVPVGITSLSPVTGIFANATPIYLPKGRTTETSFFGNVTAHIGEATEISGGLRHVNFKSTAAGLYINCSVAQFTAGTCALTLGTANTYDVSKLIYNVTLRHKFNDDLMVYAATGSSFRPPVRAIGNFSTSYSPLEVAHTSFGPESSKSYELGIKSQWMDKKVLFNATYYHQDFQSYPYRAAGAGVYYINIDAAGQPNRSQFNFISAVPVKVDGVEAELGFNPSRNFSISASLNWSKSTIAKNAKIACVDINKDGVPDTAVPTLAQMQTAYGAEHLAECNATGSATFLPEWSGTLQAEYNFPVTDGADLYVRGLLTYRGSTNNDEQNPYDNVGAYAIGNLYAGVRASNGSWELGAYVKNVGNTIRLREGNDNVYTASTTLLNVSTFRPFGSDQYSSYYRGVSVTAPREFGVNLRFAFGGR